MKQYLIILSILTLVFYGCKTHKATQENASHATQVNTTGTTTKPAPAEAPIGKTPQGIMPHTIIYKTRADYTKLVPVTMDDSKTTIVSYPAPSDIKPDHLPTPIALADGYLLDRRGINRNTVFLNISYTDYAALTSTPTTRQLLDAIIDYNPFTEIWDCGTRRFSPDILNKIISSGALQKEFKRIK